jgi:hypothetical protein
MRPGDPAGAGIPTGIMVTPDGKTFGYNYAQAMSDLYLVVGVK